MKKTIDLHQVQIDDAYWNKYTSLVAREIIPYQCQVLFDQREDVEPSHAIRNFRIAAGLEEGDFYGFVFQDSDVAKWLEAVAYSLSSKRDPALEAQADEVIALLGKAQKENGYLDTYFQIREGGEEFFNLRDGHELYCAGHLIEAGVAYYQTTGKRSLLDLCIRMADHIVDVFQSREELKRAIPGHEEIELALVRLYLVTEQKAYLDMAKSFLDRRGQEPPYFVEEAKRPQWKKIFPTQGKDAYLPDYAQSHKPVRDQDKATGHAVRAVYLYCAMADVAALTGDEALMESCKRLYENITKRQMYVTGSIGSSGIFERFTTDYDLPNDMNYSESCASIGLALFSRRMSLYTGDASYMDTAECALYNTVLSGVAMDGKSFFYVNPLSVWPQACMEGTSRSHVKPVRQPWFGCACCPPNIARTLASLGEYAYFTDSHSLWVNLYLSGSLQVSLGGRQMEVSVQTRFPFGSEVSLSFREIKEEALKKAQGQEATEQEKIQGQKEATEQEIVQGQEKAQEGALYLRLPGYVKSYQLRLKSPSGEETILSPAKEKGYLRLNTCPQDGDTLLLSFDLPVRILRAHPKVRADVGKVCLAKGPVIYCLEEVDNQENLAQAYLDLSLPIEEAYEPDLLGGTLTLKASGYVLHPEMEEEEELYTEKVPFYQEATLTFVPYAYWGNRKPGEMLVWVRE